jgi:hypothetical protein
VCPCITAYPVGQPVSESGQPIFQILGANYSYPPRYGLDSCDTHDVSLPPYCSTLNATGAFDPLQNPLWCSSMFCYVEPSACNVASALSSYAPVNAQIYCTAAPTEPSSIPVPSGAQC